MISSSARKSFTSQVYGTRDADAAAANRNVFLTGALNIREDPHAAIHLQLSQPEQHEAIKAPLQSTNLG